VVRGFADIQVGEEVPPITNLMTQEIINRYAQVTGDHNPIHVDPEFAKNTQFGGTIAHGVISVSYIFQALVNWLGTGTLRGTKMRVTFLNPVRPGDTVTAKGKVLDKRQENGRGVAACELWIENQQQQRCILIEADVAL